MTDYTDAVEARLEEEEKRLRHKAANLQERHGTWSLMARQELAVADDIRAALEEIRRVTAERDEWKRLAHVEAKGVRCAFEERAEAAEVEVERLRESASRHVCESHTGCADLLAAAKTAEIERLLCIISPGDAAAFEEHMAAREAHWVAQVERLRTALLLRGISKAPCDICGFSGPGYHQPEQHACIADGDRARATLRGGGE